MGSAAVRVHDSTGHAVHYRDEGPRNDPTPLVLLHGTGSNLHTWNAWVAALKAGHRVITLDRPGFGLTGPNPTGNYSMSFYDQFLRAFLDRLGVRRAVLVGNSSGGLMAWTAALQAPDRTVALVLLDSAGYPRTTPLPPALRMAMTPGLGAVLPYIAPNSAILASARAAYGDPSRLSPATFQRTLDLSRRAGNRRAVGETLRQATRGVDARRLKDVSAPTLILWGDKDAVIPIADASKFQADIAGSELHILQGVGHLPQEEAPAASVKLVQTFMSRSSQGAAG